ncbi:hypothetical protein ACIQU5_06085 [Streptomyces sp. NPDC090306]|uniref:hypothetical protein n=1 Tax=unclassified Streptomyces TaxID=2593676 RepID=UPI0036EC7260
MSGDDDKDLALDPAAVAKVTKGLGAAIDELGEIGDSTGSVMGKGFSNLAMTQMEAGHHGLADDFEDFCDRWEWGVRALVQDTSAIAQRLGLAAGTQWENDQYLEGTFKVVGNSLLGGNPHASEADVEKQSWGDIATPDYLHPDYSAESFEKAGQQAEQTWKDTGRSLLTDGQGGLQSDLTNRLLGVDDDTFQQQLDDTFGPSPEERAKQQDQ